MYDAMNKGIQLATGDYVGILNADDVYESNQALNLIADALRRIRPIAYSVTCIRSTE